MTKSRHHLHKALRSLRSTCSFSSLVDGREGDQSPHDLAVQAATNKRNHFLQLLPSLSLTCNEGEGYCIAPFKRKEVVLGPKLGTGEFSDVYEVQSFSMKKSDDVELSTEQFESRMFMKENRKYRETSKARYAVKRIKQNYLQKNGSDKYVHAAGDLALEAAILASLNHPHVIKLRGITHSGANGYSTGPQGYFLIIDRLFDTLDQRIISWRNPRNGRLKKKHSFMNRSISLSSSSPSMQTKQVELCDEQIGKVLDERLGIALQISSALSYLHSHGIIFRDLKPMNIGFDVRGDVKLFDFGLARVMPKDASCPYNDKFSMSGAGSPRYMSPECLDGKAYNMKADVYSFAIVLWELLAGQTPYAFVRQRHHLVQYVVVEGGRPDIYDTWPDDIKFMLESSFQEDMNMRPEMATVQDFIRSTLKSLRRSSVCLSNSYLNRRRSLESMSNLMKDLKPSKNVYTRVA